MKNFKRSIRRHHIKRLKNKRKKYHGGWASESSRAKGMVLHSPCLCSCYMCGNPRKFQRERSLKEISHIELQNKCELID